VQTQRTVVGVGRVDLLVGDRLLIEADGVDNHDGPSHRHKDLVRDANAAAWGLVTLRFDYALIVHDWDRRSRDRRHARDARAGARVTIDARLPPPLRSSPPLLATQLQGAGLDTPVTDGHGRRVAADASQFGIRHAARTRAGVRVSRGGVSRAGSGGTRSWMP
jgi:hypothetical protein